MTSFVRRIAVVAFAFSLLSVGSLPLAAASPSTPEEDKDGDVPDSITVHEQLTDLDGNVVDSSTTTIEIDGDADGVGALQAAPWRGEGRSEPSGCKNVWAQYTRSANAFGDPYYVFRHEKRWCFDRGDHRTYSHSDSGWFREHDGLWHPRGEPTRTAYRFQFVDGHRYSGHFSRYQQSIQNCANWCGVTESPWVEIKSRSDGTWRWRFGR